LPWQRLAVEYLQTLPAEPAELVVVPHGHERKVRACILQIGIGEIRAIDGAIVVDRRRNMEVGMFFTVLVAYELTDAAIVIALRPVFRIPDEFVNEVAEMQDETQALVGCRVLVVVDHAPVGRLRAEIRVLAGNECEAHGAPVIMRRGRQRAADAAAIAVGIGEAIPVLARGFEAADEHAAGPVRVGCDGGFFDRDDVGEIGVFGHFEIERSGLGGVRRVARPQHHAVEGRIARGDPFAKRLAMLAPFRSRRRGDRAAPDGDGAERRGAGEKATARELRHVRTPA